MPDDKASIAASSCPDCRDRGGACRQQCRCGRGRGGLIQSVFDTLRGLASDEPAGSVELTPAVPIRRSVTDDHIVCLEDGKKLKMLKRHLMTDHGLTPEQYRARWASSRNYPMVAPNYQSSARRSPSRSASAASRPRRRRRPSRSRRRADASRRLTEFHRPTRAVAAIGYASSPIPRRLEVGLPDATP